MQIPGRFTLLQSCVDSKAHDHRRVSTGANRIAIARPLRAIASEVPITAASGFLDRLQVKHDAP